MGYLDLPNRPCRATPLKRRGRQGFTNLVRGLARPAPWRWCQAAGLPNGKIAILPAVSLTRWRPSRATSQQTSQSKDTSYLLAKRIIGEGLRRKNPTFALFAVCSNMPSDGTIGGLVGTMMVIGRVG